MSRLDKEDTPITRGGKVSRLDRENSPITGGEKMSRLDKNSTPVTGEGKVSRLGYANISNMQLLVRLGSMDRVPRVSDSII